MGEEGGGVGDEERVGWVENRSVERVESGESRGIVVFGGRGIVFGESNGEESR